MHLGTPRDLITPVSPGWLLVDGWPLNTTITTHDSGQKLAIKKGLFFIYAVRTSATVQKADLTETYVEYGKRRLKVNSKGTTGMVYILSMEVYRSAES